MPPKKSSTQISTQNTNTSYSDDQEEDDNYENDPNFKQMVSASIQYVLVQSSKAQVIKRLDWTSTVLRPMDNNARKFFPSVHKQVVKVLNDTFGYKLVGDTKTDGKEKRGTETNESTIQSLFQGYILVNALEKGPLENRPLVNPNQYSKYALVMIIIACLKRAGGEMTAIDFWAILGETFSIRNDESTRLSTNQHKIFGDVQKLIKTDFVKEGYLVFEHSKESTGDTPSQTVKLGFRAQHEFPDHALEEFIEKVESYGIESDHDDDEEEENRMDDE